MPIRTRKALLLWSFILSLPAVLALGYWVTDNRASSPNWVQPFIEGVGGNVAAGIVGSLLFLLLTFYLDARSGEQINRIVEATSASQEILRRRERQVENERTILRFEEFLRKETYHNVRFPEIKPSPDSLGPEYVIEPVRDEKTGQPRKYETEIETLWVVKVVEPAYWNVLTPEQRAEYDSSPIREGNYYFCQFFNDSWHMSRGTVVDEPLRFHLSGKVGPGTWGENANAFMARFEDPFKDLKKLTRLIVDYRDGTPMKGSGGADVYDIYQNDKGSLFVGVGDSPPKRLYFTNTTRSYDASEWGELMIEGIRGHASGKKLENITKAIIERLGQLKIDIPRIPWWEAEPYKHDRD